MIVFKEGNYCSVDALVAGMADMADHLMTSGNTIFRLRPIKYLGRPEVLLCKKKKTFHK
jgi:hypothetical protein